MPTNSTATSVTPGRQPSDQSTGERLHTVMTIDAVVSGVNGLAYLVAADLLDSPLGLSAALLRPLGASLVVFAGAVYFVGAHRPIRRNRVRLVIGLNALWVVESLVALAEGWLTPTTVGAVWIVVQALTVALFAVLQQRALASSSSR